MFRICLATKARADMRFSPVQYSWLKLSQTLVDTHESLKYNQKQETR
jgi:hypothetical protein